MNKFIVFLGFALLFLLNGCVGKVCQPDKYDVLIGVTVTENDPLESNSSPIKNLTSVFETTNCTDAGSAITKLDTFKTNESGKISKLIQGLTSNYCDGARCAAHVFVNLPKLTGDSPYVLWDSRQTDNSKTATSYALVYKRKAVLKLEIKHDSTDVSELSLSTSQEKASVVKLTETKTLAINKQKINRIEFFNIAKGEDTKISIRFDKALIRTDTIKASQLDTISRVIKL
jgi:hypothetical protein